MGSQSNDSHNENRKHERLDFTIRVVLRRGEMQDGEEPEETATMNLSDAGFFIESEEEFELDEVVAMHAYLPSDPVKLDVEAIVRRIVRHPIKGIGVEVISIPDEDKKRLEGFIEFCNLSK